MQSLCLLFLFALVNPLCKALPLLIDRQSYTRNVELDVRVFGDNLIPVGPGVRHPSDAPGHPQSVRTFKPMKEGKYVETHNHVYSAAEVNAAASRLMTSLDGAVAGDSNKRLKSARTYPKPTSGFRPSEADRDPAAKSGLKYHYPMRGKPGNAPANALTGKTSMKVGTDRIVAYRNPGSSRFKIKVSYHDPKHPIPPTSHNHPFSIAHEKEGSPTKIRLLKAKKAVQRTVRAIHSKTTAPIGNALHKHVVAPAKNALNKIASPTKIGLFKAKKAVQRTVRQIHSKTTAPIVNALHKHVVTPVKNAWNKPTSKRGGYKRV